MGGQEVCGHENDGSSRRTRDIFPRPVPPGIELLEERPIPPLVDEVAHAAKTCVKLDGSERPVVYTIDGHEVTCSSDQPFAVFSPTGTMSKRLCVNVRRPDFNADIAPHDARLGLATIPSTNTIATIVDVFSARLISIVGHRDHAVEVASAILRSFLRRPNRDIGVLVAGDGPQLESSRVGSVAQACEFIGGSSRPLVVYVDGAQTKTDAFERLIVASKRHESVGILTTEAHPDARIVLVAGELERCSVLLRPVTPRAAKAIGPNAVHSSRSNSRQLSESAVEVAILGPVEIRNTAEPLGGHPLLTELVVYLAMHPDGATTSAWETAIWPNRRMPQQTIANRLSEARRALGDAVDGRPRLRKADERHLIADVTTDWEEFRSLVETDDQDAWRKALELVRGRPFSDLHEGQWALLEGFSAEIEHAISSLALRYGGLALRSGDPDAATWAAHRGLRATPWDERLHRLLMEAADANGDRAGVEATLRHLALVLEIDGDPLRAVHPETARLYERLLGRAASALSSALA
ncbi:MAG: bacterial transcriptional activator domain-containing protein [Acidimicrobiales bacterium]